MIRVLKLVFLLKVLHATGLHVNNTLNGEGCENKNGICHLIPAFFPFIVDNIICNQPTIYLECPRTCNRCSEVPIANSTSDDLHPESELNTGYFPYGPQTNVAMSTVTQGGWKKCFTGDHHGSNEIAPILSACSGSKLMLACKIKSSSLIINLLAWAPREDVLFETSATSPSHYKNGASWYFSMSKSWGFAKEGDAIHRGSCDTNSRNDNYRLCWHTSSQRMQNGYRCGTATYPNEFTYERIIFHRD